MANFDEPVPAGLEAADAIRALAHATLKFGDKPADTFAVLGDLLSITSSYVSVLTNIAQAHERHIDAAHDDQDWEPAGGRALARAAAQSLRLAAFQVADAYRHVDAATRASSQIVWIPEIHAPGTARDTTSTAPRSRIVPYTPGTAGPASPPRSLGSPAALPEGRSL